jgi:hypothetical protein
MSSGQFNPNMAEQLQGRPGVIPQGSPASLQRPKGMASPAALPGVPSPSGKSVRRPPSAKNSSNKKDNSRSSNMTGLPYNTPQQKQHLSHSDWRDKILWASRLILGGNSINGFLRATATAQRIKKQRARQIAINKKTAAAAAAAAAGVTLEVPEPDKSKEKKGYDQEEEEQLKKDIMNPRTAKKIKAEMEAGMQFCAQLHNLLRGVVFELDPTQAPNLPAALLLDDDQSLSAAASSSSSMLKQSHSSQPPSQTSTASSMPWAVRSNAAGGPHAPGMPPQQQQRPSQPVFHQQSNQTPASPGNSEGSDLRRLRKKKLSPNSEPPVNLPEFDNTGKRLCTKKEHNNRQFEVLRFRPLRQGDFVAARTTSRDLWILAKVLKDYPGFGMAALEFLQLTDARREAAFRDKVLVKDVEEKDGVGSSQVARTLVLPLPRTYSEAAEWCQRCVGVMTRIFCANHRF